MENRKIKSSIKTSIYNKESEIKITNTDPRMIKMLRLIVEEINNVDTKKITTIEESQSLKDKLFSIILNTMFDIIEEKE